MTAPHIPSVYRHYRSSCCLIALCRCRSVDLRQPFQVTFANRSHPRAFQEARTIPLQLLTKGFHYQFLALTTATRASPVVLLYTLLNNMPISTHMDSRTLSQQTSIICVPVYAIVALYAFLASSAAALIQGEYSCTCCSHTICHAQPTQAGVASADSDVCLYTVGSMCCK